MIGKFAVSKAGHDKAQVYVVIAADEKYVYLCDGRLKPLAAPKKKSVRHIQIVNQTIEEELRKRLLNKETIFDEQIKYAIKCYNNRNE